MSLMEALLSIILILGSRLPEHSLSEQMERQNMAVKFLGWKQITLLLKSSCQSKIPHPPHSLFMDQKKLEIFVDQLCLPSHISTTCRLPCVHEEFKSLWQYRLFQVLLYVWVLGWVVSAQNLRLCPCLEIGSLQI